MILPCQINQDGLRPRLRPSFFCSSDRKTPLRGHAGKLYCHILHPRSGAVQGPDQRLSVRPGQGNPLYPGHRILSSPEGRLDHLKSGTVNTRFHRFFVKSSLFSVSDVCASCGKCDCGCPLGPISMVNGRPAWGKECTNCIACINGCPVQAIEYGRASQRRRRGQCLENRRGRFRTEAEKNPDQSLPSDLTRWSRLIRCFFDFLVKTTFEFLSNLRYNAVTTCS